VHVGKFKGRLKPVFHALVLLARAWVASVANRGRFGGFSSFCQGLHAIVARMILHAELTSLVHSLARVLAVQMTYPVLAEILLFDQRKVSVAFHQGQRLFVRNERVGLPLNDFALVDNARTTLSTQHAYIALSTSQRHRVALRELTEAQRLTLLHHVTVVGEVGIIRASLVLE